MKTNKKSLLASGMALLASAALLAGTTFAWFTDSVTNTGNRIEAGKLDINALGYYLDGDQWDETNINWGLKDPMIQETAWEPGQYNAVVVLVSNFDSNLAARVDLDFSITENEKALADALWYKLTPIPSTFNNIEEAVPMDMLMQTRPAKEGDEGVKTMSSIESDSTEEVLLGGQASGGSNCYVFYLLEYGMYTSAGNAYQGGSFSLDFAVKATQAPVETDGFGNTDYDADAEYAVTTAGDLKSGLARGGIVALGSHIAIAPQGRSDDPGYEGLVPQMTITGDTVLDLSGKTLSVDAGDNSYLYTPAMIAVNSGTLTIEGDGVVDAEAGENNSYGINVNGGTLEINGGSYYGAITAVQVQKGTLIIRDGFFDLARTCKPLVPQYAKYVVNVIDDNYKNGTAVIQIMGGTFVNFDPSANPEGEGTSYVADGYTVVSEEQANGEIWYTVVPE